MLHRRFDGTPWSNPENYKKCSPLTYARKIKTPLLIIHSENDGRVSIEQAEQLYATLKMMRKKVEMIRFPEESHGLSRHGRPDRRIARLDWIVKWFDKYLK
jgi:dipeptidyl aminopeptidase/acylaminoacyl peptidase